MSRYALAFVVSLLALARSPQPAPSATHVPAELIRETASRAAANVVSDQQIRMVEAGGGHVGVGVVVRPAAANRGGIVHEKLTEVYFILEGAGVLVTGGAPIGATPMDPNGVVVRTLTGPSAQFARIEGGERRRLGPGDAVIIPSGVPHWFESIEGTIKYAVVRVDPERLLALK